MKILTAIMLLMLSLNAQAQISQTAYQVNLTLVAPSVCTTAAPCTYPFSRATVTSGTTCPTTASSYATIGTTPSQVTAYSDSTVTPGTYYCYIAQTMQAGATSGPSAPFGIAIPTLPLAPGTPSGTSVVITIPITTIP